MARRHAFVLPSNEHLSRWADDIRPQSPERGIDAIVVAGIFANRRVESHMRNTVENGVAADERRQNVMTS